MIAVWRTCVDCGKPFGLTRRQSHSGLFATPTRCRRDRDARRRRSQALWARQRRRRHESAATHARPTHPAELSPFLSL